MSKFKDLTGMQFGRLTVIKYIDTNKRRRAEWQCKCICGNEKIIACNYLINGESKSCGCLIKENNGNYKHGMTRTNRIVLGKMLKIDV